jgi:thiol-disulfide isomerase/thioredoxin
MKTIPALLLAATLAFGQDAPGALSEEEQTQLRQALSEAGNSPVEFTRALESHLKRYPQTPRKTEIERALAKSAIESNDAKRIIQYGERVISRDSNDPMLLEQVSRALLSEGAKPEAARAVAHLTRLTAMLKEESATKQDSPREQARHKDRIDEAMARTLQLHAMALEKLDDHAKAAALAAQSFDLMPSASASRIAARLYEKSGKKQDALAAWANAFAIDDSQRKEDRARLTALYRELHNNSETGAGDEVLRAFDRLAAIEKRRETELKKLDPNYGAERPLDFTLSGLKGDSLDLKSLRGKVVVFDFWATWCGPCRQQYPLYQQVEERFKKNNKVVFLALSTDEDRAAVKPFLDAQQWNKTVYFDDGLSSLLKVSSIPTTMVFNGNGDLVSRMNGFLPDRFVDMLSERITQALNE